MNVDLGVLPLGAMALLVALLLVARSARGDDPIDVFVGLFANPCDLGWPRGVQEEDGVRRWNVQMREREADDEPAVIEDLAMPTGPFGASWPIQRVAGHSVRSRSTSWCGVGGGASATADRDRGR